MSSKHAQNYHIDTKTAFFGGNTCS